ncbi:SDR family oxidoreductase [Sphingobacterium faecale]|uniref:SDR family oxidoreductase n=1 Tax=Sphingobacterium faecale TaxID=2803775 RepID=A0ABS1R3X3_9SPHI|nr:SDR family oxidoreductase [Sphingobacterium faecale]MBL1409397.1 SDR family oxidoreductase [Sphingobacterium faecale]
MHIKELFSLEGKYALVTGGAGNYGKCIVEALLEAGAQVVVSSRNASKAEAELNRYFSTYRTWCVVEMDQEDLTSLERGMHDILSFFPKIDIFVNNAVSRPMRSYADDIAHFQQSMEVNATGMFYLLRLVAEHMGRMGSGSVINIASMMGMKGPDYSNYIGTSMGDLPPDYFFHNAGLINLNRFMAKKYVGKNIRFNCISPGGLWNNQDERFLDNYCAKVPLGRLANKDDIKGLIVLLASAAGAYINGENILMDGGLNA